VIYESEVKGDQEALIRMRGIREVLDHQIRDIVQQAGEAAADEMVSYWAATPHHNSDENSIAASIRVTEPIFHPGGAGGGGYWEVTAGPGPDRPEHFEYVWHGTGIHGPTHMPYGSRKPMPIMEPGRPFSYKVAGQRPQQAWFEVASRIAAAHVAEGIQRIRLVG